MKLSRSDYGITDSSSWNAGQFFIRTHNDHLPSSQRNRLGNASGCKRSRIFLWSFRRGFVSRLNRILFGHVFALSRRAVKTRAFPVINTCLGVNPYLAMASARRRWIGGFLNRAPRGHRAGSRTRFRLSLPFLGSWVSSGRSGWRAGGWERCSFLGRWGCLGGRFALGA